MNEAKLGQLIDSTAMRDAIHVAIVPVTAPCDLEPGTHVDSTGYPAGYVDLGAVGIVDPYLRRTVKKGERFWLCLYPGTVTGMRHHWTHPAFAPSSEVLERLRKEAGE